MCSIEDDGDLKPLSNNHEKDIKKTCVKCDKPGVLVTRIHDPFCKDCFQVYVVHKFRASIGKSKLIRDGERVLVAFSGGANSSALLNLIQDGLSVRAHKKLRFIPTILHIDESCLLNEELTQVNKQDILEKISEIMCNSGFSAYISNLENGLVLEGTCKMTKAGIEEPSTSSTSTSRSSSSLLRPVIKDLQSEISEVQPNESSQAVLQARLQSVIQGFTSASSKEDFIKSLRNKLMVHIAQLFGITKILTAESSTRIGIRILSDVAQGRGSQVSLNGGFSDFRYDEVSFIRPLRDLNSKELMMYNFLFNVETVTIPCITSKEIFGASIERLTEHFVTGLQADYQSTVSNIVRTSEKLGMPDLSDTKCVLCQSPLDTKQGPASALSAVEFSLKLSQSANEIINKSKKISDSSPCTSSMQNDEETCCDKKSGNCHTRPVNPITFDDVIDYLCYGCRLTLRNFSGNQISLPNFLLKETEHFKQRDKLREEIADFLLEDTD